MKHSGKIKVFSFTVKYMETLAIAKCTGSTIKFPQISSEALSQLTYNLLNSLMGFKVTCQLEKEPLKGLANVQEIIS